MRLHDCQNRLLDWYAMETQYSAPPAPRTGARAATAEAAMTKRPHNSKPMHHARSQRAVGGSESFGLLEAPA